MKFENPAILYALFLLLIPVIIHLVKWRKFKTELFTNVDFLHELEIKSRKSRLLRELLILFLRLLAFTALILAFAKPYMPSKAGRLHISQIQNLIYLDNSMSLDALDGNTNIWQVYIQDLLQNLDKDKIYTFLTNDNTYKDISGKKIMTILSEASLSPVSTSHQVILKRIKYLINPQNNTRINVLYASDMQNIFHEKISDSLLPSTVQYFIVDKHQPDLKNISVDSLWIKDQTAQNINLVIQLSANDRSLKTPVQVVQNKTVLWRSFIDFKDSLKQKITFDLPSDQAINGKISITDKGFQFDNQLFFTIDKPQKTSILIIAETIPDYLKKIYTNDEFILDKKSINQLSNNDLYEYDLIILSDLNLPDIYFELLNKYMRQYGQLVILPTAETTADELSKLLAGLHIRNTVTTDTSRVFLNRINYDHPLFDGVFTKQVHNFAYPFVNKHFKMSRKGEWIYQLSDRSNFVQLYHKTGQIYVVNAALNEENTNFTRAASLIVPLFYQISKARTKRQALYYTLNMKNNIFVKTDMVQTDQPVHLRHAQSDFIPYQINQYNGIQLSLDNLPGSAGIYEVTYNNKILKSIAFNVNRQENSLEIIDFPKTRQVHHVDSAASFIAEQQAFLKQQYLWHWLLIAALVFLIVEMLLLRYWKL